MEKQTAVLGNFQITLPAPNGASVSVSGYVYEGESKESLDERMDLVRESLVRQQLILEVPVLEKEIQAMEHMLSNHQKAYADLLEKTKAKHKLTSQDEAAQKNYPIQIKQITSKIEEGRMKIAEVKKAA